MLPSDDLLVPTQQLHTALFFDISHCMLCRNKNATTAATHMGMPVLNRPYALVLGSHEDDVLMTQGVAGTFSALYVLVRFCMCPNVLASGSYSRFTVWIL